ncbi:hypothetical protein FACS189430_05440 [Bacteroidia bacterium]|nr:hypothetical protein FACS189430_05440 [Bacteroidia bacterium]
MKKLNSEMFRKFGIAALTAAVFVCTPACNKDDDDNGGSPVSSINATVENGASYNSKVDSVKAFAYVGDTWARTEIAKGSYADGKFKIDLPETVPAAYLETFDEEGFPEGITVSNKQAKRLNISSFIAYKGGNKVGEFDYGNADETAEVFYMFVDADVTIKGSYTDDDGDTEKYDVTLKKGWNEIYVTSTKSKDGKTFSFSNSKPSGLKWIFEESE